MIKPSVDTTADTVKSFNNFNCTIGNGFWYFDVLDMIGKKPEIYEHLLSNAKDKVWIWDPYTNKDDFKIFEMIDNASVDVRCLAYSGINTLTKLYPQNRLDFIDNVKNVQCTKKFGLEIRIFNTFINSTIKNPFHARYLFIDDNVFIVGASMSYHNSKDSSSISSTAIYRVDDIVNKNIIINKFEKYWNDKSTESVLKLSGGEL